MKIQRGLFYRLKSVGLAVMLFPPATCAIAADYGGGSFTYSDYNETGLDFTALGDLIGGNFSSKATGVSADGSTIVGYGTIASGLEAFRWTAADGMTGLGGLTGWTSSYAHSASEDGSVIVGYSANSNALPEIYAEAFRWTQSGGMVSLGDLTGGDYRSVAFDVSADGNIVVGVSSSANGQEAFRWTQAGGMSGLGYLSGVSTGTSFANAISGDGSVIVGESDNNLSRREAFRWTQAGGMAGLGTLGGGAYSSRANDVSADGTVVVGTSGQLTNGDEAFRWTQAGGMVSLGGWTAGYTETYAYGVSADGSVVVGEAYNPSVNMQAFRWTETEGIQTVMDLLEAEGIDMTGWQLKFANDVSADGTVIVGGGSNPNSSNEAWVVRLGSGILTPNSVGQSVSTLSPASESALGLVHESLDAQLMASRHYHGHPGAKLDFYASGFGGEWHSYTAGGTVGLAWSLSDFVRLGAGVFTSTYNEDDLAFSGSYELDSFGGTFWAGYETPQGGLQLHVVGLLAELDNEIERGYLNGSGLDKSEGDPDGNMSGMLIRLGWKFSIGSTSSLSPYASYSCSEVKIDGYTETGGGFPARFDSRNDNAEVVKLGVEGETKLSEAFGLWGQAAYGHRMEDYTDGISGEVVGLMAFDLTGYNLDNDWYEADMGVKWQIMPSVSVMLTAGSAFDSEQNPDWRTSLGISWAL